ncbi:hypothetical protein [Microvirga sp. VF16]|uniref:hypothetical protein n=1 Tax=Microvirga sp. VF16 TaxID=2807101 RepID=UPI00193D43B8|nr:hypothetical protein [Microvirga sp. VF16]QRM32205.1 hypothetical protein JO965_29110 [Microvirga sp. VF16]
MTLMPYSTDVDIKDRFRVAGVVLPPDRVAGACAIAQDLVSALHWLRQPRTAADEIALVFTLQKDVANDLVPSP